MIIPSGKKGISSEMTFSVILLHTTILVPNLLDSEWSFRSRDVNKYFLLEEFVVPLRT